MPLGCKYIRCILINDVLYEFSYILLDIRQCT